jgi:asparagine synthase (glutamine-hydrolysing)
VNTTVQPRAEARAGTTGGAQVLLCAGHHEFLDPELAGIAATHGAAAAWVRAFERHGIAAPTRVRGDFAVAVRDGAGRTFLAVDRFAIRTLCYAVDGPQIRVAARADELVAAGSELEPQALFDYLYFHVIPAPQTVHRGVERLPAGHGGLFEHGKLTVAPWWTPSFEEGRAGALPGLREEFRALLETAVTAQAGRGRVGCFLSGGTDSSTVAGMLGLATGSRPATFSIGFDAEGYDEMAYARIAARHFNADHHEYYVTPDDLVRGIPRLAVSFDQPFGNSSVVPAFYCAQMAREAGVDTMLAGDGGDELFGGNTRYARQKVFAAYERVPASLRNSLLEGPFLRSNALARVPVLRKAQSYVEQARVPMPDRMQAYNLLRRVGISEVLTPGFLAGVDVDAPLRRQRTVYAAASGASLVNRMLAYDWRYTLADNDLPKVTGATALAGVEVGFPLLDDRIVDFSLRLPPSLKVRGLTLRWFFKDALRGFLPDAIITKSKHGFGLPFGVWLTRNERLMALALESLALLRDRGVVRPEFLDRLATEYLPRAPGYYGEMIWILMMLGQWEAAAAGRLRR